MVLVRREPSKKGTYVVEVHVDATVEQHNEVPNRIDALNRVAVAIVGAQEPRVFRLDKVSRCFLGPKLEWSDVSVDLGYSDRYWRDKLGAP